MKNKYQNQSGYLREDRGLWGYSEMWHSKVDTSLFILFINLIGFSNVIFCAIYHQASINVLISADWCLRLPYSFKENSVYLTNKSHCHIDFVFYITVKLVNLQNIKSILWLNYLQLYQLLLFQVEIYFSNNLFGWLLIAHVLASNMCFTEKHFWNGSNLFMAMQSSCF